MSDKMFRPEKLGNKRKDNRKKNKAIAESNKAFVERLKAKGLL